MDQQLHFTFSEEFSLLLMDFVRDHYQEERKTYKANWQVFRQFKQHEESFEREKNRLLAAGYDGNIEMKFFQAGRYYFRKKLLKGTNLNTALTVRRPEAKIKSSLARYISPVIAEAMDRHIETVGMHSSPALAYDAFYRTHQALVFAECTDECLWDKLKKTYKNKYHKVKRATKPYL